MSKRIDLTGQKFDKLIVIKYLYTDKYGQAYWLCKCACKNETVVRGDSLRRGNTKSCGCLKEKLFDNRILPEGIAARNSLLRMHKSNAKKRNIEQALTDEQIIAIHKENCHYCGASPSNIHSCPGYNGSYIYSGIDRLNNDKGYTIDNVVPCCINCNYAKRTKTYNEFLNLIKRICLHLNLEIK